MVILPAFAGVGGWEVLLILAIALVIFGPRKIPEFARGLGRLSARIQDANRELQRELHRSVEEPPPDDPDARRAAAEAERAYRQAHPAAPPDEAGAADEGEEAAPPDGTPRDQP